MVLVVLVLLVISAQIGQVEAGRAPLGVSLNGPGKLVVLVNDDHLRLFVADAKSCKGNLNLVYPSTKNDEQCNVRISNDELTSSTHDYMKVLQCPFKKLDEKKVDVEVVSLPSGCDVSLVNAYVHTSMEKEEELTTTNRILMAVFSVEVLICVLSVLGLVIRIYGRPWLREHRVVESTDKPIVTPDSASIAPVSNSVLEGNTDTSAFASSASSTVSNVEEVEIDEETEKKSNPSEEEEFQDEGETDEKTEESEEDEEDELTPEEEQHLLQWVERHRDFVPPGPNRTATGPKLEEFVRAGESAFASFMRHGLLDHLSEEELINAQRVYGR